MPSGLPKYPATRNNMDNACVRLCAALNQIPGIRTVESCCGHGEDNYLIWIVADSLEALPNMLYWFARCHCGFSGWWVVAVTDCCKSPVKFMIKGPIGEEAYQQADRIAQLIEADLPDM